MGERNNTIVSLRKRTYLTSTCRIKNFAYSTVTVSKAEQLTCSCLHPVVAMGWLGAGWLGAGWLDAGWPDWVSGWGEERKEKRQKVHFETMKLAVIVEAKSDLTHE